MCIRDSCRPDPDDVPAARQGAVRGTWRRVPQLESARSVAAAELGDRADPDVLPRHHLPAGLPGVHGRAHHDRPCPLHRHGHRVERAGEGRQRVRRGPGGSQQRVPGSVLLGLRLGVHHRAAAAVRPFRRDRRRNDRPDRQERLRLPRHPVARRDADAAGAREGEGQGVVPPGFHPEDLTDHPGRVAVHDRGDVLAEGAVDRPHPPRRAAHRGAAADLLRRHVPLELLDGEGRRRRLQQDRDAVVHCGVEQLRARHRRLGGGLRHQLGCGVRRGDRTAGRGAGAHRPRQRRAVLPEALFRRRPAADRQNGRGSLERMSDTMGTTSTNAHGEQAGPPTTASCCARPSPIVAPTRSSLPSSPVPLTARPAGRGRRSRWIVGVVALMTWVALYVSLAPAARAFTYGLLRLTPGTPLASAVEFFMFESPKVLLLLTLIVFGVGVVRSFFTPERTRRILAGTHESVGNVLAALLGVVTPFCSCSAVPLFIGFVTTGVPLGVTFSFLVSAPMVNEVALVLLFGLFGWKVAAVYMGTGLAIAMISGWAIGRLRMENHVEDWVFQTPTGSGIEEEQLDWPTRIRLGMDAVKDIVGRVWLYVLVGIGVGAAIHGYVPENFMASMMGKGAWWSVPLAVLIGVPMYSNAAGIIPIVQALLGKGAALGTVLAFMMSVSALSLPEAIILRKVLRPRLIATFFGVVALGILIVGYLFNLLM